MTESIATQRTSSTPRTGTLAREIGRGVFQVLGLARMALWRLRYYSGLSLLALSGIVIAVGLVTSAAFFSQAVDKVMLDRELAEYSRLTQRHPFAARVFAASSPAVPFTLERLDALGEHVAATLADEVGLPVRETILLADSGILRLFPPEGDTRYAGTRALADSAAVVMTGIGAHMTLEAGTALDDASVSGDALDVWMHRSLGERLGVEVGDRFEFRTNSWSLPVVVAGVWSPTDSSASYWINNPDQILADKLVVRRQDYINWLQPALDIDVRTANWQVILDESKALPAQARAYKEGFERAAQVIPRYLPDARTTTPTLTLDKFVGQQTALTTLLLGFNVPALGFLLYFLVLTSAVIAYWQRRETSLLRSRGITRPGILNFTLIETLLLFVIGVPLGLVLGVFIARWMGYTDSFLSFVERTPLPVSVYGINLPLTVATLAVVAVAKLWTVGASANDTVVTQAREHARPTSAPFWYRAYLDLILIIPTVYAYRQFVQRGSLAGIVQDRPEDLYQDPLLILVPGMAIITMALLAMRGFPLLMRTLDLLARWIPWFPGYLAMRQLGRQSHAYINPLLLVIVSLALGVYTLSMAASMDQWLADRVRHSVGADMAFTPYSERDAMADPGEAIGAEWVPPVDEFTALEGVQRAARVARYNAEIDLPGRSRIEARFVGIDRIDFPLTAWFRNDFARESLGGLMNRLAPFPDGILVSQAFMDENALRVGDRLSLLVIPDYGVSIRDQFTIVGAYTYFPTVQADQVVVVGHLEQISSYFGITMPHHIWLRLEPGATRTDILAGIESTGIRAVDVRVTEELLNTEQAVFQRVGVFGTLTVSFLAAAVMAALGLLTYSYASLHERLYQFSVLRAVGLRRGEVVGQVALEYAFLTAYGAAAGVVCGSLAAYFFVPLFRMGTGANVPLPPLIPIIAQDEIVPLALLFAAGMIVLELIIVSSAFYRKQFEALRLGHHG